MSRNMQAESGTQGGKGPGRQRGDSRGGKFLTFFLAGEEYGLEILRVQEIIGIMDITPVPRTPECIRGVINLRGKVIPIVDLRRKFGMDSAERTAETCVIVVEANRVQTGIVVDKVSEVLDIAGEDIEDTPSFGAEVRTDYILGIGKTQGRVRLLLDIDRVLDNSEFKALASTLLEQAEGELVPGETGQGVRGLDRGRLGSSAPC
jgi:purine-binding chemotaxis protein CheW